MAKRQEFHLTLYIGFNDWTMLGLKLIQVGKKTDAMSLVVIVSAKYYICSVWMK